MLSGCTGRSVRGNTWPGLSASENVAYLADGPFVFAVNIENGNELWRYPSKQDSKLLYYATPYITSNGWVIIGGSGSDSSLVALDPTRIDSETKSPAEAWKFTGAESHWVAAPLEVDGTLYAPNSDGSLYILDVNSGQLQEVIPLAEDLWAQPVTDGKNLYISSLDHSLIALDKNTNQVIWHEDLGSQQAGRGRASTKQWFSIMTKSKETWPRDKRSPCRKNRCNDPNGDFAIRGFLSGRGLSPEVPASQCARRHG